MSERKIARDAGTGRFVSRDYAASLPERTVVETIRIGTRRRRVTSDYLTEENQNEQACTAGRDR